MEILGVPPRYKPKIIRRWNAAGAPPFCEFAPYAAHILTCSPTSAGRAGHLSAKKNSRVGIACSINCRSDHRYLEGGGRPG